MFPHPLAVWCDGRVVPPDYAVPLLDPGYTHGFGVFESFLIRRGRAFALSRHLRRLGRAAETLGLPAPGPGEVEEGLAAALRAAGSPASARARVQLAGAQPGLPGVGGGPASGRARLSVVLTRPSPDGVGGVRAVSSPWVRNERSPLAGLKTTSYAENLLALREARTRLAQEALLANTRGELCEGATTNVYVERAPGIFVTPPTESGCLPGIMRELILEWAITDKWNIRQESVPFALLGENSTILVSNAVRGLVPVTWLDGVDVPVSPSAALLCEQVARRRASTDEP